LFVRHILAIPKSVAHELLGDALGPITPPAGALFTSNAVDTAAKLIGTERTVFLAIAVLWKERAWRERGG
jgi:hypothetical protein